MNLSIDRLFNKVAFILLMMSTTGYAQWSDSSSGDLMIRGGWLFDGVSNTRRQNTGIVIREGKIVEVDADLHEKIFTASNVIDLSDSETILPGMIELPGWTSGNLISPIPALGPDPSHLMSLLIFIKLTATVFSVPLASTIASNVL